MARDIGNVINKTPEEVDNMIGSIDEADAQYLRERPWLIEEYERRGYTEPMKAVREGSSAPEVSPEEAARVTTDDLRVGVLPHTASKPRPNGVVEDDEDDEDEDEDDYQSWTKSDLEAEVDERNQGRSDADKISKTGTKQELVDRLQKDDQSTVDA